MGVVYGILPHSFCIAFAALSIFGATTATSLIYPLVENKHFGQIMILIAFTFATLSAVFHLASHKMFSWAGIKKSWRYLVILYVTTIVVNLILFFAISPSFTRFALDKKGVDVEEIYSGFSKVTLEVNIPCSAHAFLVTDALGKLDGVKDVKLNGTYFDVFYDKEVVSVDKILSIDLFKEYSAKVIK